MTLYEKIITEYKKIKLITKKFEHQEEREITTVFFWRPLSTIIMIFCQNLTISPNAITTLSVVSGIVASILFLKNNYSLVIAGTILLFISLVIDTIDGQYARYKNKTSEFGHWYDGFAEKIRYALIFSSLSVGFYYNNDFTYQFFFQEIDFLKQHKELILVMGIWCLANLLLVISVQAERTTLSFDYGTLLNIPRKEKRPYYLSMQVLFYLLLIMFLITNQIYLLFVFFSLFLPICWLYPFYKLFKNSQTTNSLIK